MRGGQPGPFCKSLISNKGNTYIGGAAVTRSRAFPPNSTRPEFKTKVAHSFLSYVIGAQYSGALLYYPQKILQVHWYTPLSERPEQEHVIRYDMPLHVVTYLFPLAYQDSSRTGCKTSLWVPIGDNEALQGVVDRYRYLGGDFVQPNDRHYGKYQVVPLTRTVQTI